MNPMKTLYRDERGAAAVEYGLIAAMVSVAIIATLGTLGDNLNTTFQTVVDGIGSVVGG